MQTTRDTPESLPLLQLGPAHRFGFPWRALYYLHVLPSHSKLTPPQHPQNLKPSYFHQNHAGFWAGCPNCPTRKGDSSKLEQVLVTARFSGKMGPTIQINGPRSQPHKICGHQCCGSWLHLKMRYCFVPTKPRAEKRDKTGSGMPHLLERPSWRSMSKDRK